MVWIVALTACSDICRGPACEDAWPAGTLLVADGTPSGVASTSDTVEDRLEGGVVDGVIGAVTSSSRGLVIGLPERGAIRRVDAPRGVAGFGDDGLDRPGERFGYAVAVLDSDGDGVEELWVGAPAHDDGRGAVYRYALDATDPDDWDHRFVGRTAADGLGSRVVACGDLDGDGDDDLLVSAPRFASDDPDLPIPFLGGAVFALLDETSSTDPRDAGAFWWGDEAGAAAGDALLCDLDVTGDGQVDAVIGVPFAGPDDAGRVQVRAGGPGIRMSAALTRVDLWTVAPVDEDSAARFGSALARFGDGLAIGAPHAARGAGEVHVYAELAVFPGASRPTIVLGNPRAQPDHLGRGLAAGPDPDTLLIGAPDRTATDPDGRIAYDVGAVWVWDGVTDTLDAPLLVGSHAFARVGAAPQAVDLDRDGRPAILLPIRSAGSAISP